MNCLMIINSKPQGGVNSCAELGSRMSLNRDRSQGPGRGAFKACLLIHDKIHKKVWIHRGPRKVRGLTSVSVFVLRQIIERSRHRFVSWLSIKLSSFSAWPSNQPNNWTPSSSSSSPLSSSTTSASTTTMRTPETSYWPWTMSVYPNSSSSPASRGLQQPQTSGRASTWQQRPSHDLDYRYTPQGHSRCCRWR